MTELGVRSALPDHKRMPIAQRHSAPCMCRLETEALATSGWKLTRTGARYMARKAIERRATVGVLILNGTIRVTVPSAESMIKHRAGPYMEHLEDLRQVVAAHGAELPDMELFLNFEDHPAPAGGRHGLCEQQPAAAATSTAAFDSVPSAHDGGVVFSINRMLSHDGEVHCPGVTVPQAGRRAAPKSAGIWRNLLIPWHYHASRTCELRVCGRRHEIRHAIQIDLSLLPSPPLL
jgi:hypothetical protein